MSHCAFIVSLGIPTITTGECSHCLADIFAPGLKDVRMEGADGAHFNLSRTVRNFNSVWTA